MRRVRDVGDELPGRNPGTADSHAHKHLRRSPRRQRNRRAIGGRPARDIKVRRASATVDFRDEDVGAEREALSPQGRDARRASVIGRVVIIRKVERGPAAEVHHAAVIRRASEITDGRANCTTLAEVGQHRDNAIARR